MAFQKFHPRVLAGRVLEADDVDLYINIYSSNNISDDDDAVDDNNNTNILCTITMNNKLPFY